MQPAQHRGSGEIVSYPLSESPEQSGPGRPAKASTAGTYQGTDGQSWAATSAMPDSSTGAEHPGGPVAQSDDTRASQSSTRAEHQSGSGESEHSEPPDKEDSNQNSAVGADFSPSLSSRRQQAEPSLPYSARGPVMRSGIRLDTVEWHSRIEKDWYAATVFVDLLTFIYVAIFYQVLPSSLLQPVGDIDGVAPCSLLHALQQHVLTYQPKQSLCAAPVFACWRQ